MVFFIDKSTRFSHFEEFSPRVTITSALPYVNGVKHLGNIVGSLLPADIFHRFLDIMGVENIYVCGTDDHGTAVEIAAAAEKISPADFAKKYYRIQKEIYDLWNIDFTFFGSTSSPTNRDITQALFKAAYKNGYILHRTLVVPYCENDKRFLPDRYIIGTCPVCGYDTARGDQCEACSTVLDPADLKEPKCEICGKSQISFRQEKHLFLDYSMLSQKLDSWIKGNNHWPHNTRALALGWIKQGLKPRGITRNLEWGIKVPLKGFENLVFYVWFDAPIGYVSITKDAYKDGRIEKWKEYWTNSKIYHFLGKDNIPFHTIFWPATLMAAKDASIDNETTNISLPYKVIGYEYLNWEGKKFSTSKGIGLFSDEAVELFPIDYWRFYLTYVLPESKDSNFDWSDFGNRINGELIANYGNLFYRVTYFIKEHFDGHVPKGTLGEEGEKLFADIRDRARKIELCVKNVQLREALRHAMLASAAVNKYFQDRKPWDAIKEKGHEKHEAADTLFTAVNALRSISILLYPFIPSTAEAALAALGVDKKNIGWDVGSVRLHAGHRIEAKILFKKIEDKELERAKKYVSKYAKKKEVTEKEIKQEPRKEMIKFEDFNKVDLIVGTILDVRDHPNADKLYILQVDMGKEIRQLVAGLRQIYKKEDLLNKQVIVIANLEPKELRGEKSHGMLLATDDGTIVTPLKKVQNGTKIR